MPRHRARLFLLAMFAWLALVSTAFAAPCCAMQAGSHHHMPAQGQEHHASASPCTCVHATATVDVAVPMSAMAWRPGVMPALASLVAAVDIAWQPPLRPPAG